MSIAIEGFSVVALKSRVKERFEGGLPALSKRVPNATEIADDDLWRCSFMAMADAQQFTRELSAAGLNAEQGPDPDVVLVDEFHQTVEPYCEWLQVSGLKSGKGVIAWLKGSDPSKVVAREGWSVEEGSGLHFEESRDTEDLEFLRVEGNVEVYRHKKTGKEVYTGRTQEDPEIAFKSAAETIMSNTIHPGESPIEGEAADSVRAAVDTLERLEKDNDLTWNAYLCMGKGRQALGDVEGSYWAFKTAWELEKEYEGTARELAGVCLQLGRGDEAVEVSEHAAALKPDDLETLGNLANAYLIAGRLPEAQSAIHSALKLDPNDQINQTIAGIIQEVQTGARPQPASLEEMMRPLPRPKKSGWRRLKFWE